MKGGKYQLVKLSFSFLYENCFMYLMYVDESGDSGIFPPSPTKYFILSAITFQETFWLNILDDLIQFKKLLKGRYGLLMKEEIHASVFISKRVKLQNTITRNDRLDMLKKSLDWLNSRTDISIITVRVDKTLNPNPFERAWHPEYDPIWRRIKKYSFEGYY